jgi:hypothetical protein
MCSLKLPLTVIEIIDEHRKNYLWRGKDFNRKRHNLATWDLVRKPKDKGGLGVINLSIQNDALLLKELDKFYRKGKYSMGCSHLAEILQQHCSSSGKRKRLLLVEGHLSTSYSVQRCFHLQPESRGYYQFLG